MKKLDILNNRYGKLKVISECGRNSSGILLYLCQCDCGGTRKVVSGKLRSLKTTDCGCVRHKNRVLNKHRSNHPMYKIWDNMLTRCYNKNSPAYINYGLRGIKVCDRWHNFDYFVLDMSPRPANLYTIDREDNNGDYTPENCRWADGARQANNKCTTVHVTFKGLTRPKGEWVDELHKSTGLLKSVIRQRITKGWELDKIIATPADYRSTRRNNHA